MADVSLTLGSNNYPLTVVNGTELQLSLSGPAGPTGPTGATGATGAAGPNTVSTSTTTSLNGYLYGNGTTVGGATAATSSATANTLVLRDGSGGVAVSTINNLAITAAANSTLTIDEDKGITLYDSITTEFGGYINTDAGGYIVTGVNGNITTGAGGYIQTGIQGYIYTNNDGHIQTGSGGYVQTAPSGYIQTGSNAYIDTTAGGSFATGTGNLTGPNTSGTLALTSDIPTVDATIIDGSANAVAGNAVFDALALKAPLISPSFTTPTLGAATATTVTASGVIFTTGASANISTQGTNAYIYTAGADAFIATSGTNAYIQSRSTFKLFNGTYTTTLSHSPTDNRAIAFPNKAGTVAMVDAETHTGAHAFSSTTRPTSEGTGTPAATSLITRADGDTRFGAVGLANTSSISITSQATPQTIRSAALAVGVYHVRMVFHLVGTVNTGTRHGYNFSGTSTIRFFRSRASSAPYVQVTSTPSFDQALTEATTSAVIEGIIQVTAAGTFSMQAAQNTSHPDSLSVGASSHMIITPCPNGSIS